MNTTVVFLAVVVFAFVAGRVFERLSSRLFFLSGVEYMLVGVVLGPVFAPRVISLELLAQVDLFVSTVLGIIGFLSGLALRRARSGIEPTLAGLSSTLGVILVVATAMTAAVQWLDPTLFDVAPVFADPVAVTNASLVSIWMSPDGLWMGLTIGAAAGASSAPLIETAIRRYDVSSARADLLRSMAGTSEFLAVFCFGMAMAGSRATASAGALGLTVTEWSVITVAAGVLTGVLFSVFLGSEDEEIRITVASVGVIVFSAGVGAALSVSPLFVNLIAGATVSLTSPHARRLSHAVEPLRFPSTVLVLLLAGATWAPPSGAYWALVPLYAILRFFSRRWLSAISVSTFLSSPAIGHHIGRALMPQGALASAISVAFAQLFPELSAPVTTTILGGMLLSDVLAFRSIKMYLADAGEIQAHIQSVPGGKT